MRTFALLMLAPLVLAACTGDGPENRLVGELSSDRIELTAESTEPVVEIAVSEGERVTHGQLLLRQDSRRARARLQEAEALLGQARARLDELVRGPRSERIAAARAGVEGAAQDLAFRESGYRRARQMYDKGLGSPQVLDEAEAALDAARSSLDLRRAQLAELLTGTRAEELAQAEHSMKQAEARRDAAAVDLDRLGIRAPVDGIVDTRLLELGERPAPGQPVITLLPGVQPHARVYVPESMRVKVAPGTAARIFVDGLEDPVEGRVRWVASEAAFTPYFALTERDRGRLSFVTKVNVVEERDRLPDGVPVEVELVLR